MSRVLLAGLKKSITRMPLVICQQWSPMITENEQWLPGRRITHQVIDIVFPLQRNTISSGWYIKSGQMCC
jgi:hypothetical protein